MTHAEPPTARAREGEDRSRSRRPEPAAATTPEAGSPESRLSLAREIGNRAFRTLVEATPGPGHGGRPASRVTRPVATDPRPPPAITSTGGPVVQRDWRSDLEDDLGVSVVAELENKVHAGALKVLATKLPARTVRTVVRFFSGDRITSDIVALAQSYADHAAAIGLDDLNYLVDVALNDGWDSGSLPGLIAKVAQRDFGQSAHVLVHAAATAGWTAAQTSDLIETGHGLGEDLVTLAQKAAPRNWTAAQLAGSIQAALDAGITDWDAMGVAIGEPEVSADELVESFAIRDRFAAGNNRVKGRAGPATMSADCAPVVVQPAATAVAPTVQVHFAEGDLAHYRSGHSYPDFALTRGNIRRAPQSTLFPPGTDVAAQANASLAAAQPALTAAIQAGGPAAAPNANGEYANNNCMFFDAGGNTVRMDQCFPTEAAGEPRSKGTLLAVKAFVDP